MDTEIKNSHFEEQDAQEDEIELSKSRYDDDSEVVDDENVSDVEVDKENVSDVEGNEENESDVDMEEEYVSNGVDEAASIDPDTEKFEKMDSFEKYDDDDDGPKVGFWECQSIRMARHPRIYFWIALIISLTLGVIGLVVGEFSISANNAGWRSRGTLIADRQTQLILVRWNRFDLFEGSDEVWDNLINNVQPGRSSDDDSLDDDTRRLQPADGPMYDLPETPFSWQHDMMVLSEDPLSRAIKAERNLPFYMTEHEKRRLQIQNGTGILEGCDISWYSSSSMTQDTHLWPIWKAKESGQTALDPELIRDLCEAEEITQEKLVEKGLCETCEGGGCLPPYGLVFYARLTVDNGFSMDCETLSTEWKTFQESTEVLWQPCVEDIKASFDPDALQLEIPQSCPMGFYPSLLDEKFDSTGRVEFTSSVFATVDDVNALFDNVDGYDRGSNLIEGAYDTQYEDFVDIQVENSLNRDMALALGSAFVTAIAMLVHTRSPFLTLIGILQIILSFPLSYFVYTFIARLDFFPFLNFIGVFVVFALGADDVFVVVDKWKNARIEHHDASTEFIAAVALPDAAGAMFLTTITTAVAFFGTAICPVAPIMCFAVFCGLLIVFDYIMCVALVFPALCMYDAARDRSNCCLRCHCCNRCEAKGPDGEEDDDKPSLIRRILLKFYELLHRFRWLMFVLCCAGLAVSIYFAVKLELPTSSDVRLIDGDDFQYERNSEWRLNILYDVLVKQGGSSAYVIWGVKAADTGNHNNPDKFSQLVLDDSFNPSDEDVQVYMQGFCDKLFEQELAEKVDPDYVCPINAFDTWLQEQSASATPDDAYALNCGGAATLPVAQENFDACIVAWSKAAEEVTVFARNGVVEIMYMEFGSRVRFDSPFDDLDSEWNAIEDWMENERRNVAPVGVQGFYHSSEDFWWYDTNGQMLKTAYGAAAIALAMAAAVILISSRSFVLTLFSVFTIGFILNSVTALLVGLGWTLGFLESICFAILIGISCDFVIHFTHAYASLPGQAGRGKRTKHALIQMGPSILASAFTTIAAATIMLFTVITFFEKFATILFLTIVMATVGSFVVFLTLADCIGPSRPTYLVDKIVAKCMQCKLCKTEHPNASKIEGSDKEGSDEQF